MFVEGNEEPHVIDAKHRRLAHREYLIALDDLKHGQFEWACRGMLTAMGVRNAKVTRRSADEGIDFYGQLELQAELSLDLSRV